MEKGNEIARLCVEKFDKARKKIKEIEWEILAGVVVEKDGKFSVVSLATGSKCLGKSKLAPLGNLLNDCHAEVLVRRALLHYLETDLLSETPELFERKEGETKFELRKDIKFHLYISLTPCGDSSVFPLDNVLKDRVKKKIEEIRTIVEGKAVKKRKKNSETDAPPAKKHKIEEEKEIDDIVRTGAKIVDPTIEDSNTLKLLRTKPGQGDRTNSLSCSDKIARWNVIGFQGALLSLIVSHPLFFSSIVVEDLFNLESLKRSLFTRLKELNSEDEDIFVNEMEILPTTVKFCRSKEELQKLTDKVVKPATNSWIWNASGVNETIMGCQGVKVGTTKKAFNNPRSRSSVCKIEHFNRFLKVLRFNQFTDLYNKFLVDSYYSAKHEATDYQKIKQELLTKNIYFSKWLVNSPHLEDFKPDQEIQ